MWPSLTADAIRKMKQELKDCEFKAHQEIRSPSSRALGEIRRFLVQESRRNLWYMEQALRQKGKRA